MNWCFNKHLYKNKYFEVQLMTTADCWYDIFHIDTKWNLKGDHAGISLTIYIIPIMFNIMIYDRRHWDYEHNRWCIYENK